MGSRPAPVPDLSAAAGTGRAGGDQRAAFPFHLRSCPADEIPHLSAKGTVRLPRAGNRGACEELDRKLALGDPGSEHLQRPNVKEVRAPRGAQVGVPARLRRTESAREIQSPRLRSRDHLRPPGLGRRTDRHRRELLPVAVAPSCGTERATSRSPPPSSNRLLRPARRQSEKMSATATRSRCGCVSSRTNVTGDDAAIDQTGETCRASSCGSTSAPSPHRAAIRYDALRRYRTQSRT